MEHLTKGVWFVTARRLIGRKFPDRLPALVSHLDPAHQPALLEPIASVWYPEDALQSTLKGLHREIAKGDNRMFESLLEEASELGIDRFFTAILKLTTPSFLLARIPTMWAHLRRGSATVTVERHPEGSMIKYRGFPYYDDPKSNPKRPIVILDQNHGRPFRRRF